MKCIGCGATDALGLLGITDIVTCRPCADAFAAVFSREPVPGETLTLPAESAVARIADAVLEALGVKERH